MNGHVPPPSRPYNGPPPPQSHALGAEYRAHNDEYENQYDQRYGSGHDDGYGYHDHYVSCDYQETVPSGFNEQGVLRRPSADGQRRGPDGHGGFSSRQYSHLGVAPQISRPQTAGNDAPRGPGFRDAGPYPRHAPGPRGQTSAGHEQSMMGPMAGSGLSVGHGGRGAGFVERNTRGMPPGAPPSRMPPGAGPTRGFPPQGARGRGPMPPGPGRGGYHNGGSGPLWGPHSAHPVGPAHNGRGPGPGPRMRGLPPERSNTLPGTTPDRGVLAGPYSDRSMTLPGPPNSSHNRLPPPGRSRSGSLAYSDGHLRTGHDIVARPSTSANNRGPEQYKYYPQTGDLAYEHAPCDQAPAYDQNPYEEHNDWHHDGGYNSGDNSRRADNRNTLAQLYSCYNPNLGEYDQYEDQYGVPGLDMPNFDNIPQDMARKDSLEQHMRINAPPRRPSVAMSPNQELLRSRSQPNLRGSAEEVHNGAPPPIPSQFRGTGSQNGPTVKHQNNGSIRAPPPSAVQGPPLSQESRPPSQPLHKPHAQSNQQQPTTSENTPTTPVTTHELERLRIAVQQHPSDQATALLLAKRLVEASEVLTSHIGDAKHRERSRERYIGDANKMLKKLVSIQNPEAMFFLADCLGRQVFSANMDANNKEAFMLYQSAAKLGHPMAAYRTAVCCEIGHEDGGGTRKDPLKAMQWYNRAATLGDTPAMYKIGMIKLKGLLGQQPDPHEAVTWLKRAAERADAENPHALHELALLYQDPDPPAGCVVPDQQYAFSLFLQAAQLGYKFSQFRIGSAFEFGQLGCPIDPRESITWHSRAALQEEHQSELALAGWYLTGSDGVLAQNDMEAYLWARKAATAGLAKAEYAMGYFTEVGIGVTANLEDAKRWYWRAAAQDYEKARERLEEIKRAGTGDGPRQRDHLTRSTMEKANSHECIIM